MNPITFQSEAEFAKMCGETAQRLAEKGTIDCIFSVQGKNVSTLSFVPESDVVKLREEVARLRSEIYKYKKADSERIAWECHRGND